MTTAVAPELATAWRTWIGHMAAPIACGLVAFCLAALWGMIIPLGEAPDEPGHVAYVTTVMEGRLPPLSMPTTPEAFQPPLAYLVAAAVARPVSAPYPARLDANPTASFDPATPRTAFFKARFHHPPDQNRPWTGWVRLWHLLRLVSAGWLMLAATMTYLTARRLLPESPALWPLVAAGAALLPQQVFIGMTVSNDVAVLGMAALATWALTMLWQQAPSAPAAVAGGALAGALMLTKLSLLPLAVALVVLPALWHRRWPTGALSGGVGLLLWLPWAIRLWRFDGDPTGLRANLALNPSLRPPDHLTLGFWHDAVATTVDSLWGRFGWMNIALPAPVAGPATVVLLVLMAAGLVTGLRRRERLLWATLAGLIVVTLVAFARYTMAMGLSAAQGRLLIACAPPAAVLAGRAVAGPLARLPAWVGWLGVGVVVLLDCLLLFGLIRPAYR